MSREFDTSLRSDAFYRAPGHFLMEEIQALPYADIPSALTLALQKLELVNQLRIDSSHRPDVVQPFNYSWRKINAYYLQLRTSQKYVRQADASELDQFGRFTRGLSYSYQLALESQLGTDAPNILKAELMFNAMFFIGQAMLQAYSRYSWVEPGLWQQLHQLYRCAEFEKCAHLTVSSPLDNASKQTITQLYAEICLLSVADPYHMQPGEVWILQQYLHRWSNVVEVQVPNLEAMPAFCFCVNLYSHLRPFPLSSLKNYAFDGLRWIQIDKIENMLKHHLHLIRNGHSPNVIETGVAITAVKALDLLERALVSWAYTPTRQNKRIEQSHPVGVVWTLNDIYRLLDANSKRDIASKKQKVQLHHKAWGNTENASESGVRVHLKQTENLSFSVGEVVGMLINGNDGQKLQVGIVQWTAQGETPEMLRCGIQYLPGSPRAALVDLDSPAMGVRPAILLVKENPEENYPNTMILPTGIASLGDTLLVATPDLSHAFEIVPNKFLIRSDQIDHCSFDPVNEIA